MPFQLTILGVQGIAGFDLSVEAGPNSEAPHQDFEFLNIDQWNDREGYCLQGLLRNRGRGLQDYLVVAAVLYDNQDNIVNFGGVDQGGLEHIVGDGTMDFEICVEPPNQNVVRYELRAWGQ